MTDGGLMVLDGAQLGAAIDYSMPDHEGSKITGARLLELTESRASESLCGLSLPETLKTAARKRINLDTTEFQVKELKREQAIEFQREYIAAIADELHDDPLLVATLNGSTLKMFLEDEDDFAMLAENLFTDLDIEDLGKLSKSEIRNALVYMGVEMGVPPFSELPELDEILKKHGAEGEDKIGQAQFAQLLQPILQELADTLNEKNVIVARNMKIINGSKLRKLLLDGDRLNGIIEKMYKEKQDSQEKGEKNIELFMRSYLEKNGKDLGLPPSGANEALGLLFDSVFAETDKGNNAIELDKDKFFVLVREMLEKFSQKLEANPVFDDSDC